MKAINLKPFYFSRPTKKRLKCVFCSKCLSPHYLYQAIKRTVDSSLPNSLSEYLWKSIKCLKEPETDFYNREYSLVECGNE